MAQIPEYKQKGRIEPSAVADFSSAFEGLSKSYQGIGDIGTQLAQTSSNIYAREAGAIAAKTPGRELFPGFTESTAEFNKAYQEQEYNIALNAGMKQIEKASFEALKMPSARSLELYDQTVKDFLEKTAQEVTPQTRRAVSSRLEALYLDSYNKISGAIFEKGVKFEQQNFQQGLSDSIRVATDLIASGNSKAADAEIVSLKEKLNTPWAKYYYSEGARKEIIQEIEKNVTVASGHHDMDKALRNNTAEKFLSDTSKLSPTAQNITYMQAAYDAYRMHTNLVHAEEDKTIAQYSKLLVEGKLTNVDMAILKNSVMPGTYAKFELQVAKSLQTREKDNSALDFFNDNYTNSIALSNLTNDELNKGFDARVANLVGDNAPTLLDEAIVAREVQATIPIFNKRLEAGINSNDPQTSVASSGIFRSLLQDNPLAVGGIDTKSAMKAQLINDQISAQASPLDAWKYATNNVDNLRPEDIRRREELFDEEIKAKGIRTTNEQLARVQSLAGFSGVPVPPGIATDYISSLRRNYVTGGDFKAAEDLAVQTIKSTYGFTYVNGDKQVVYLPIEKMWPNGNNEQYIQNLIIDKAEKLFIEQKALFDEGNSPIYYKFPEGVIKPENDIFAQSRLPGNDTVKVDFDIKEPYGIWLNTENNVRAYYLPKINYIPIVQVDANGNEVKGRLIVSSDRYTMQAASGTPPSYGILFQPDGKTIPTQIFSKNYSQARIQYTPQDYNFAAEHQLRTNDKKALQTIDTKKSADELRQKIIELREALGEDQYYEG